MRTGTYSRKDAFSRIIPPWEYIYKYDEKGNRIEETRYELDGAISWKEIYSYNDSGKQTELIRLGSDGKLIFKFISTYDDQVKMIINIDMEDQGEKDIVLSISKTHRENL